MKSFKNQKVWKNIKKFKWKIKREKSRNFTFL